ncbi:Rrf2 family transcriptional regulator [Salmonella enterica]|nr:Rrf2 family transcriptional regulator [Salmonella enterica]
MKTSTPQRVSVAVSVMAKFIEIYAGSPVSIQELSQTTVSVSYLEQVFTLLRRAGLIVSTRGPGGGYAPVSTSLTVADVVRALNPDGFLTSKPVLLALESVPLTCVNESGLGRSINRETPAMNNELTRAILIGQCTANIETLKLSVKNGGSDTPHLVARDLEINRIALAALNASQALKEAVSRSLDDE